MYFAVVNMTFRIWHKSANDCKSPLTLLTQACRWPGINMVVFPSCFVLLTMWYSVCGDDVTTFERETRCVAHCIDYNSDGKVSVVPTPLATISLSWVYVEYNLISWLPVGSQRLTFLCVLRTVAYLPVQEGEDQASLGLNSRSRSMT